MTTKNATNIQPDLIAPCGMNCGVCRAHLRARNRCVGCNVDLPQKLKHCLVCSIRTCDQKPGIDSFCFDCKKYPCARIKQLDKRYITKYGMSMIDNLDKIKNIGLKRFMKIENTRWVCAECGGLICVHDRICSSCGRQYPFNLEVGVAHRN